MEWINSSLIWFIIGLFLILMEFALPGVIIIFFGLGAWLTALLSVFFKFGLTFELLIFLFSSVLFLVLFRKKLLNLLSRKDGDLDEKSDFIGKFGIVREKISLDVTGKVEFNGSLWEAESNDTIEIGKKVKIIDVKNITFIVEVKKGE